MASPPGPRCGCSRWSGRHRSPDRGPRRFGSMPHCRGCRDQDLGPPQAEVGRPPASNTEGSSPSVGPVIQIDPVPAEILSTPPGPRRSSPPDVVLQRLGWGPSGHRHPHSGGSSAGGGPPLRPAGLLHRLQPGGQQGGLLHHHPAQAVHPPPGRSPPGPGPAAPPAGLPPPGSRRTTPAPPPPHAGQVRRQPPPHTVTSARPSPTPRRTTRACPVSAVSPSCRSLPYPVCLSPTVCGGGAA